MIHDPSRFTPYLFFLVQRPDRLRYNLYSYTLFMSSHTPISHCPDDTIYITETVVSLNFLYLHPQTLLDVFTYFPFTRSFLFFSFKFSELCLSSLQNPMDVGTTVPLSSNHLPSTVLSPSYVEYNPGSITEVLHKIDTILPNLTCM